jgi:pyridoxamine 5'-phosphate oxidase
LAGYGLPELPTLTGDVPVDTPEFESPPTDPIALLHSWIVTAVEVGVREPGAMVIATADERGHTSSRVVLLKDLDDRGVLFSGPRTGRKGAEIAANPWAAANFYWRETGQQINLAGPVEFTSDEESDDLFAERSPAARATTVVSRQSEPLGDEQALRDRAAELVQRGEELSRPDGWGGYLLVPARIEFWCSRSDRLHRRLRYTRSGAGWTATRLQP